MKQKIKKQSKKNKTASLINLLNNKYTLIISGLIISIIFIYNYSAIFDKKLDQGGDNIYYISLGKSLAEGNGFTNTMGFSETPHTHFPPGYPVFMAGLTKIFPDNFTAFKIVNGILLYFSIVLLFLLFRKITGNTILSLITCLLCCLHSDLLRWATIIMSEMLFLFLSVVTLYMSYKYYYDEIPKKKKWIYYTITAIYILIINYIYFVRTMGLSLIIPIIIWFGLISISSYKRWRKNINSAETHEITQSKNTFLQRSLILLLLIVTVAFSKLSWDYRNKSVGATESSYAGQFNKKLYGETMSTTKDWTDRIQNNTKNYISKWVPNSLFFTFFDIKAKTKTWEWVRGLLILGLMITGLFRLKKIKWLMFFYIATTMAVLLFYPEQYGGSRYYLAIIPFFIFLMLNGISELIKVIWKLLFKKHNPFIWQTLAVVVFSLYFMFPVYSKAQANIKAIANFKSWKKANNIPLEEYITAIEWCKANLPKNARVMCRKPELYYIYSGYKHAEMFPQYGAPDTIMNRFIQRKATHVIIDNMFRHAYVTIIPTVIKYPEKFKLIHQIGKFDKAAKRNATLIYEFNPAWGYVGDKVNGIKEGKGYEIYQNDRKYVGEFSNNLPNGYGEFYDLKGKLLAKGTWKDGKLIKPAQ